jgi:hypothetical protein
VCGKRIGRDLARGRRAAGAVRRSEGSAFKAALAYIEATFAPAIRHAILKDRVAALIAGGPGHEQARMRYRRLAQCYPALTIEAAIAVVERLRRAEVEACTAAIRSFGHPNRPRLALMILDELRLILRLLRLKAPQCYPALLANMLAAGRGPRR